MNTLVYDGWGYIDRKKQLKIIGRLSFFKALIQWKMYIKTLLLQLNKVKKAGSKISGVWESSLKGHKVALFFTYGVYFTHALVY